MGVGRKEIIGLDTNRVVIPTKVEVLAPVRIDLSHCNG
jgi:hypothetical protein